MKVPGPEHKGNTVREDLEEIGNLLKIDFTFNVVLDRKKISFTPWQATYIEAHRAGCEVLDSWARYPSGNLRIS